MTELYGWRHIHADDGISWMHMPETKCDKGKRFGNPDVVNHPQHYKQYPVEVIEITERLSFVMGNIVKYVLRADHKGSPLEDLRKAKWYLEREISNREKEQ